MDWLSRNKIPVEDFGRALNELTWRVMHFPLPTVAVVNGELLENSTIILICILYKINCNG